MNKGKRITLIYCPRASHINTDSLKLALVCFTSDHKTVIAYGSRQDILQRKFTLLLLVTCSCEILLLDKSWIYVE